MHILECDAIWAWYAGYEVPILRDLSCKIPKGFTIFCGPNGSGKTTLLRIIRGLHENFGIRVQGRISIGGINPLEKNSENLGEDIGIVFQRPYTQLFNLTVADEVRSGPLLLGYSWEDVLEREKIALELMDIFYLKNRLVFQISGGEQQKTIIAAILAMRPKVLLLDEPTSFLDPASRKQLLENLKKLNENDISILMTSHRLEEEAKYADYLAVFDNGKISLTGEPENLIFSEKMNKILPPRSFFKVSNELYKRKITPKPLLNPRDFFLPELPLPPKKTSDFFKSIINFENVSVSYPDGTKGLEDVSFSIPNGVTTIIGANGSGKTTIAKACLNLLKTTNGKIIINGKKLQEIDKTSIPKIIGYVTQDPNDMIFCDSVYEEVMFGVKNFDLDNPEKRVEESLAKLDIKDLSERLPETLSLGQQRRLTLAITLAMGPPKIIFLDEPELALDPSGVDSMVSIITQLKRTISFVILTHDVDTFIPLSDYTIIMKGGKVLAQGNPRNILDGRITYKDRLKMPELWNVWKAFPIAKTWDELSMEIVKIYADNLGASSHSFEQN